MEGNHPKINRDRILARFILVVFLVLLVGFYSVLIIPIAYSKKVLPNVSVAGIDLSGKDLDRAKSLLSYEARHFDKIKIQLKYGQKKFTPTLSQLGISVDIEKTIEKAYSPSLSRGFWNDLKYHLGLVQPNEIMYEIKVDEKKYNAYFRKLGKFVKRSPVNASLEISGSQINFIPGKEGLTLTAEETKKEIVASLKQGEIKSFVLKTKKNPPYIQEPQTLAARKQAEKWMASSVTIIVKYDPEAEQTSDDRTFTATGATIGSWINFSEGDTELVASISTSSIGGWIGTITSGGTIPAINKKVQIIENKSKVLNEGVEGQAPNTDGLSGKVASLVKSGGGKITIKTRKLAPQEEIIGGVLLGRFDGKYIEIVLSQQKLYAVDGKKLVNSFLISSGRSGMGTPTGQFKVISKTTWAACKPSPSEYTTCFMPFSMFFTGSGHAIHELPIIDGVQEGHWHLGVRVSHGCVRLGVGPAAYMYNWTPVGTPVIIHN